MPLTPHQIKDEVNKAAAGSTNYNDMIDHIVKYIVMNWNEKKNRPQYVAPQGKETKKYTEIKEVMEKEVDEKNIKDEKSDGMEKIQDKDKKEDYEEEIDEQKEYEAIQAGTTEKIVENADFFDDDLFDLDDDFLPPLTPPQKEIE